MNLEKVAFAFFIVFAATLNFGFFLGGIDNPEHHNVYELFAAIVVNLIATVLKFGDRTQIGAVHLSTSLVADFQLDHLHGHVVPRWNGDTNFIAVLGDVRVMPEHLDDAWRRLHPAFADLPGVRAPAPDALREPRPGETT